MRIFYDFPADLRSHTVAALSYLQLLATLEQHQIVVNPGIMPLMQQLGIKAEPMADKDDHGDLRIVHMGSRSSVDIKPTERNLVFINWPATHIPSGWINALHNASAFMTISDTRSKDYATQLQCIQDMVHTVPLSLPDPPKMEDLSDPDLTNHLKDKQVFLYIGQVNAMSNVYDLVRAYYIASARIAKGILVIVNTGGAGGSSHSVTQIVHQVKKELDRQDTAYPEILIFESMPNSDVLNALFTRADVFVTAAFDDTWGIELASAIHMDKPVIASSGIGLDFLNSNTAMLLDTKSLTPVLPTPGIPFDPNTMFWRSMDVSELAAAMVRVVTDYTHKSVLPYIEEKYSQEKLAEALEKAIQFVASLPDVSEKVESEVQDAEIVPEPTTEDLEAAAPDNVDLEADDLKQETEPDPVDAPEVQEEPKGEPEVG